MTCSVTVWPGCSAAMAAVTSSAEAAAVPFTAVMRSPAARPAFAAGLPAVTAATVAPGTALPPIARDRRQLDAEVGVRDRRAGEELIHHLLDGGARDREADAHVPVHLPALDLRVHPDHVPLVVEQRAPGAPVVDRGVGLDDARDRVAVDRLDGAVQRAHDAGGRGVLSPKGLEMATTRSPTRTLPESANWSGVTAGPPSTLITARSLDASAPTSFAEARVPLVECHRDGGRARHDVVVGHDVALVVDDEARALGLGRAALSLRARRARRRASSPRSPPLRPPPRVDLADGQAGRLRRGREGPGRGRRGRRPAVVATAAGAAGFPGTCRTPRCRSPLRSPPTAPRRWRRSPPACCTAFMDASPVRELPGDSL